MSPSDSFGTQALLTGLFGVTIGVTGTDIFSETEVLSMALVLVVLGSVGIFMSMGVGWYGLGSEEVSADD